MPSREPPRSPLVLRVGHVVANVNDLEQLPVIINALIEAWRVPSAGAWGPTAAQVVDCSATAVTLLGTPTLAKGLAPCQRRGRPPTPLQRDLRVLDGAAALLRHPGSACTLVERLRAWLAGQPARPGGSF